MAGMGRLLENRCWELLPNQDKMAGCSPPTLADEDASQADGAGPFYWGEADTVPWSPPAGR